MSALPNVDFPTITVSATLPGASPETMASSVATPLEQQFAAIPGLASMNSVSGLGATSITLQFELNRKIDGAATDVQTAINAASGLLPKDLPNPPTYRKVNPADRVGADLRRLVRRPAALQGRRLRLRHPGAEDLGGYRRRRRCWSPASRTSPSASRPIRRRSPRTGISLEDVRAALTASTVNQAKGNLENDHQSVMLDTNDQLFNADAYKNIIVAYRNGAPVKLQDIGDVDRRHQVAAHRRLVQRQARRAAADLPPARRQHRRDRRPRQGA